MWPPTVPDPNSHESSAPSTSASLRKCETMEFAPGFSAAMVDECLREGKMSDDPHTSSVTRRAFVAASAGLAASAAAMPVLGQTGGASRRVIIDTDPGGDDAFALLLAMRSPELRIEGITPVAGNVPLELTLPNALRMVEIAGRTDIPVAAGASRPLERRLVTATYAHGENGLGGAVFPAPKLQPIADTAADFIRRTVRKYPGEVTLITLGPQTNMA